MRRGPCFMAALCPPCLFLACVFLGSFGHCAVLHVKSPAILWTDSSTRVRKLLAPPSPLSQTNGTCGQICGVGFIPLRSDSGCECVIPISVGLELEVTLDIFLTFVMELGKELADGTFLQEQQVNIDSANPVSNEPDKTAVMAYLTPLGVAFDAPYCELVAERFWTQQVFINESLFGNYTVDYVTYPGLNLGPPAQTSNASMVGAPSPAIGIGGGNGGLVGAGETLDRKLVVLIALLSGFGFVLIFGAISVVCIALTSRENNIRVSFDQAPMSSSFRSGDCSRISSVLANSTSMSFISSIAAYAGFIRTFTLFEVERATESFSPKNVVGEGGFGRVYRGLLEDGCKVAVKVLTGEGSEFVAEVEVLSRLHHRNLVKLIGICTDNCTKCLIYELVSNGSLESHLHGVDRLVAPLDWRTRVKIALGAARGLAYLHEDSSPCIIHRDFKASNILLEDDFTPKVSDFGLAKVATEGGNEHVSTRVMGTFGYVAPEYAMTGHLLVKSDVYSYGVVLLELLTGRKPVNMDQPGGQENLVTWARPLLINREALPLWIDPSLGNNYPPEDVAKMAGVAYRCVHPEVSQRPFMGEVVQALKLIYRESGLIDDNVSIGMLSRESSPTQGSTTFRYLSPDPWGMPVCV
ncbi:unnamed protein product [Calypogeia fissa]